MSDKPDIFARLSAEDQEKARFDMYVRGTCVTHMNDDGSLTYVPLKDFYLGKDDDLERAAILRSSKFMVDVSDIWPFPVPDGRKP